MNRSKVSILPESVFSVMEGFASRADAICLALNALVAPMEEKGEMYGEAYLVELLAKELNELNTDLSDYGTSVRVALNDQQEDGDLNYESRCSRI